MRRFGVILATVGGAGYFPIAPGTVGSAIAIPIYLLTSSWSVGAQATLLAIITLVGVWASTEAARHFNREDPGHVVIDEVAGQLVTLFMTGAAIPGAIAGFFIFRILDIIKPWPAARFERFPGGVGIMADDLMAGVYGNLALRGLFYLASLAGAG